MFSKFLVNFEKHSKQMPWDDFIFSEGAIVAKARNLIHSTYLKDSTAFRLMMLDSDILFPPTMLETLLAHNLPIVGGWYRDKKADDHHPVVFDFVEEKDGVNYWHSRKVPGTGLEKVDGMGAGCWLMHRDVAEALGNEPYDMNAGGEDMGLCRKLMKLEIPLYVDWSINCAHAGVGVI
jgi:hypothetical protein